MINKKIWDLKAAPTAYLIDDKGEVGKKYGAKTTPHIFIINNKGILVYEGAIDDIASTDESDLAKAKNYVREILDMGLTGKPVEPKATKSYGCSVKY